MAKVAVVQGVPRYVSALMKRTGLEVKKKIAKKTYEVFFVVSRAFGARHGNVSCMGASTKVWTALYRRAGRVRNRSLSAWVPNSSVCLDELRAKNTIWGGFVSYRVAAVGSGHPQGWDSMGEQGAV